MSIFYLQPISSDYVGASFDTIETYEALVTALNTQGCEEFEIQFIDGDDTITTLIQHVTLDCNNVEFWIEFDEYYDDEQMIKIDYLLDNLNYGIDVTLEKFDDVQLVKQSLGDYAYDLTAETSEVPEHLSNYIDYDEMGKDMENDGGIFEIGNGYIVTNHGGL